jgi:ankyrin repeat protein
MIGLKDAATAALLDDNFEPQHALQAAAFAGDEAKVSALLGADPKGAATRVKSPLDEPLVSDALEHPNLLRSLLAQGLDPNDTGASGRTPLMTAARLDLIEAARILLERGAEVDAGAGAPVANIYPESDDVTCQMIGEAPVSSDTPGRTALSYAAELASPEMVQLLLEHGATPERRDENGHKPLDYVPANDQGRATTIRELLK